MTPNIEQWMIDAADAWIFRQTGVHGTERLDVQSLARCIASHAPSAQWISVDRSCPQPNQAVLFWTVKDTWESGYFRADDNEPIKWEAERTGPQDERIDFFEGEVTHWMIPSKPSEAAAQPTGSTNHQPTPVRKTEGDSE